MKLKLLSSTLVSLFVLSSSAFAHNGELHKGKPVEGSATAVTETSLIVKGDKGETKVTLIAETKFEAGMEGKAAERSDLKEGDEVMVYGTKLGTGELVAKEIMIHSKAHDSMPTKYKSDMQGAKSDR